MNRRTLFICQAAIIAAIYVAVVFVTNLIPGNLNFGPIQLRLSEALTVLPAFTPTAIPGLFLGCFLSNFLSPNGFWDMLVGPLATLLAAVLTYAFRKYKWFAPVPPVVVNALVIGSMLYFLFGENTLTFYVLTVGVGQAIVCFGLGYLLMRYLKKNNSAIQY